MSIVMELKELFGVESLGTDPGQPGTILCFRKETDPTSLSFYRSALYVVEVGGTGKSVKALTETGPQVVVGQLLENGPQEGFPWQGPFQPMNGGASIDTPRSMRSYSSFMSSMALELLEEF